jgi:hypothetical protein
MISDNDRMDLKRVMANSTDYQDNTAYIRASKHSRQMSADVRKIELLAQNNGVLRDTDLPAFTELAKQKCPFLFSRYTDIFNRLVAGTIDISTMYEVLRILRMIEDGEVEQEEGSLLVGRVLKKLYVDSAVRAADKLASRDSYSGPNKKVLSTTELAFSWKDYKLTYKI